MGTTIIEFILVLIAHAIAGIYSSTLKYTKKMTYIIWGSWIFFQGILLYQAEFAIADEGLKFFLGFILSIIGQYVIFFITTKGKFAQRVFTMLTYSVSFCMFMTLFTMVKDALTPRYIILSSIINAVLLLGILYYFLGYVCPLCHAAEKNITKGWTLLIYTNIVFLITVICSSIYPVRLTSFNDPGCVLFIFLCVSIMSVYPVVFSNIINMSEVATKREVERQNKLLLAQIEMENIQLIADRQARHDRRHHNLVMLEFVNRGDIDSVREYLNNLVECETKVRSEVKHCDNITVNTVLTVYERRANENDVSVKILANVSREIAVLTQDIVIVIANLFENAINATSKLTNKNKYIDISIKESSQRLLIKIENSCSDNMKFDESFYGIGINSIITTAEKYDGMYDFSIENGVFVAKISLNLK